MCHPAAAVPLPSAWRRHGLAGGRTRACTPATHRWTPPPPPSARPAPPGFQRARFQPPGPASNPTIALHTTWRQGAVDQRVTMAELIHDGSADILCLRGPAGEVGAGVQGGRVLGA